MLINTSNIVSISEANQNFSKVVKKVDENESVIILKNNKPKYILRSFNDTQLDENDLLELIARRLLQKYKRAFEVLGK